MLLDARGLPQPNAEILERLQQIDGDLGLAWQEALGCWAITFRWQLGDPRWRGPSSFPYDALAFLPRDASSDDAYGYVVNHLRRWGGTRGEVQRLLDRVHLYNKQRRQELAKPVLELADELLETNRQTLLGGSKARTKLPGGKRSRDAKRLREFLHDAKSPEDF